MTLFHALGPLAASIPAGGDLQFITSVTGSAASAINIDNCFSASYDHYLILRNLLGSAAGNNIDIRLRSASTDASGANYRWQNVYASSTTVAGSRSTGVTAFGYGFGYTEATSIGTCQTWISNPFAAVRTTLWTNHSSTVTGNIFCQSIVGEHDLTTSYDGLSVIPGSGTITGTIYVYGLKV